VSWSRAFQLASKSGIIVLGRQADAACSNGSRCISGWRRVRDAGCDGFDVSWPREVIGCREPWGLTMWAWTWNDGTNGPWAIKRDTSIAETWWDRCSRSSVILWRGRGEERRGEVPPNCCPRGCWN
jgi:hypothetical protein